MFSNLIFNHILIAGDDTHALGVSKEKALVEHYPAYLNDVAARTRISVILNDYSAVNDFVFEYQELFDNSYWRIVDLSGSKPRLETHRPQYEGMRKDFVDVEWEFIIGGLSNPILQSKIRRWARDDRQILTIALCFDENDKNLKYADILNRRLPDSVQVEIHNLDAESESEKISELLGMAKYLNYFYKVSYELCHVPTELPEDEVDKAWNALDDRLKMSNIYNVMSIPFKMMLLGHDRDDWDSFYALTADEIERLTEIEHNRWCVERLLLGSRPCSEEERRDVEEDMRLRLADPDYAMANPVSLKKRYKNERNAHFDLCAFSELGLDETGLPVTRYDRDLTAAIPLIVKTYHDRNVSKPI